MMLACLKRLLIAVMILAFTGGMTLQAMPPAFAAAADAPMTGDCAHMHTAMTQQDLGPSHAMPCKGMTPECVKQMGCLGTASLPLRPGATFAPVAYNRVVYSVSDTYGTGRSIKPDLSPPIGL